MSVLPSTLAVQSDAAAVGRERSGVDLPLVVGEPVDLLGRDVEQCDIVVAVVGVRGDEEGLAVG